MTAETIGGGLGRPLRSLPPDSIARAEPAITVGGGLGGPLRSLPPDSVARAEPALEGDAHRWWDDLIVVLAAVGPLAWFTVREHAVAGVSGFPLDDSWIHLQFARNLAAGAGFSYNPGVPVAGSTAPLWTLLLAAGALVAGPSVALAKTLGVACTIGAALVLRRGVVAWGSPRAAALLAAVAFLWMGPVAWGALSGMEVGLAALLVAAALLALARDRTVTTAACGALAVAARPEAFLLLPFLAVTRRPTWRRLLVFVVAAVAVLAPIVAFSYATVGAPYPATAAAKVEGGLLGWLGGVHEPVARTVVARPWAFVREWVAWLLRSHWLLPLALPVIPLAWRQGGRALGVAAVVLLAHPLGMALLAPYRGPAFQEGRYSIHLLPVAVVVLAVGLGAGLTAWRRAAATVVVLGLALVTLVPAADRYAWGVQNIEAMQVHLGHWLDGHVPRSATLAVNDIGAIAYVSRRQVIDLMGLVTPDILPYRRAGEAGVMRYLAARCPDYVVIFPTWFPTLAAHTDVYVPIYRVRLERVEVSGGPEMVVYRVARCAV